MPSTQPATHATRLLAIILASYLMIVLDVSIVISALPRIHHALGFSSTGLSWVQNAYTLAFGGLLLLGARAGDLLGRRRMFVVNVPVGAALILAAPRYLPETERRSGRFDLPGAASSTFGMTALVFGIVHAASAGWSSPLTLASLGTGALLLAFFVLNERRAEQPITPLRLFMSRERSGAYGARVLFVGAMFGMFFFLTQFLQGVNGYGPLKAGIAFLPMTGVMFAMVFVVPNLVLRLGSARLLAAGVGIAFLGMAWLSRISPTTPYLTGIAIPMVILGIGAGAAFTPLTAAGVAGVSPEDAGAASGLVNVAHQLGGSLGLGVLVTVFAAAAPAKLGDARDVLAHRIASSLGIGALMLALALTLVVAVVCRPTAQAEVSVLEERLADETEVARAA
jgi:hypothetical protein